MNDEAQAYYDDLDPLLDDEQQETEAAIAEVLGALDEPPKDPRPTCALMYTGYRTAREDMVKAAYDAIETNVGSVWTRELSTAVSGAEAKTASGFLANVDHLYMGKYVTDPRTIQAATDALVSLYTEAGMPIGHGTDVSAFVSRAGGRFRELSEWKTRQIVDTSVSRARTWSRIYSMHAEGIATYVIVGPVDNLTCDYCATMVGVEFDVATTQGRLSGAAEAGEENLAATCPFLTGYGTPEQVAQASSEELQSAGVELPPYHPSCRHEPVFSGSKAAKTYIRLGPLLRARVLNFWRQHGA